MTTSFGMMTSFSIRQGVQVLRPPIHLLKWNSLLAAPPEVLSDTPQNRRADTSFSLLRHGKAYFLFANFQTFGDGWASGLKITSSFSTLAPARTSSGSPVIAAENSSGFPLPTTISRTRPETESW
jgi:hypothetical protein